MKERSSFTSRIGFVLAAAGSAVGLGNMWRFPYLAAKYGGGAFLITYVLLAVTFGFTLIITEVAMGRRTRMSCIEAFGSLNRRFAPRVMTVACGSRLSRSSETALGSSSASPLLAIMTGSSTTCAGRQCARRSATARVTD